MKGIDSEKVKILTHAHTHAALANRLNLQRWGDGKMRERTNIQ